MCECDSEIDNTCLGACIAFLPGGCFDVCMHPKGGYGSVQIRFVATHTHKQAMLCGSRVA